MKLCRLIAPDWLMKEVPSTKRVLEGMFSDNQLAKLNTQGYGVYWLPNHPIDYDPDVTLNGSHIDKFEYVFVDCDLKDKVYASKDSFLEAVAEKCTVLPTLIVDSGNGVHVYWKVSDLDVMSYLRLSRRMMRFLKTDEAVGQIFQLMRTPGTINTKVKENFKPCEELFRADNMYTCEELDRVLPAITVEDEKYCQNHFSSTYNIDRDMVNVDYKLPAKFGKLCNENHEVKSIWSGSSGDRSKDDFRLGHIMFANGFNKEEAMSVLVNSAKAMTRAPVHRVSYAQNIIGKIWTYEIEGAADDLSDSVASILKRSADTVKGTPFRCHKRIDNTANGFRLGQVLGLVAGSGVGKTSFAMNMFRWFSQENPDYHHMFVPLEQPAGEIADRWKTICGGDDRLDHKVHIMSNYDKDGNFRHLSLEEIKAYIVKWQEKTGNKLGCVVIDHVGALKKKGSNDENQDLITICHSMKAFAIKTNTFLVMQSQTNRSKAGIGDLELDKDAAYGTMFFEAYCDYLVTLWQPVKRCHSEPTCPTVTAFKYCKIRHKKPKRDTIQEDVPYYMYFDSESEQMRDMTQDEETAFKFFLPKATNKRKADKRVEVGQYSSVPYKEDKVAAQPASNNQRA